MSSYCSCDSEMTFPVAYDEPQMLFYPITTEQPYTYVTSPPIDPSISDHCFPDSYSLVPPEMYTDHSMTAYPSPSSFHSSSVDMAQINDLPPMSGSFDAESSQCTSGSSTIGSPIPGNLANLTKYGFQNPDGTWRCAYPGCSSRAVFTRGCDLRKHFNRHSKHLFCRYEGCPQATEGGFSSNKDRTRHEAKHNPGILCEWKGCNRVFSRVDNMKDHVRRIHKRRRS